MQRTSRLRPVQASSPTGKVGNAPCAAARRALDLLVIGLGHSSEPSEQTWGSTCTQLQLAHGSLHIDAQADTSDEEKTARFMQAAADWKHQGKVDNGTLVVVNLHGVRIDARLQVGDTDGKFSVDAARFIRTLREKLGDSPHRPFSGVIVLAPCGAAALGLEMKHGPGHTISLSGHKSVLAAEVMEMVCVILRAWSQEPRSPEAPALEQVRRLWKALREHCGEHVSWSGGGKIRTHKAGKLDFERGLGPDKRGRVAAAKLLHGSLASVQRVAGAPDFSLLPHQRVPDCLPVLAAALSERESQEKLRYLMAAGERIDELDSNGESALYLAARCGHRPALQKLLSHAADPWLPSKAGWLPWQVCEENALDLLLADPANTRTAPPLPDPLVDPLHAACAEGGLETLKKLDPYKNQLRATDAQGNTPLGVALLHGQTGIVEYLLQRGANPNAWINKAEAPLAYAVLHGHTEAARLLLKHEAKPLRSDRQGMPLLMRAMHAVRAGRAGMELLELVLETDAGKQVLRSGLPLHYACHLNAPDIACKLLEKGVDPWATDGTGIAGIDLVNRKIATQPGWDGFELKLALLDALQKAGTV